VFDRDFEVIIADTAESKKTHYHLRYQVYCLDVAFEDASMYPDRMEWDEYDQSSVHFLVRSRVTGHWVGAMRMILGDYHFLPTVENAEIDSAKVGKIPGSVAEISRLCVVSEYRRNQYLRKSKLYEQGHKETTTDQSEILVNIDDRRKEPEIMLGLLRAAYAYSLDNEIDSWYFMVAPSLARILHRLSLNVREIGPLQSFHGERAPHACDMTTFAADLHERSSALHKMFNRTDYAYHSFSETETYKPLERLEVAHA